MTKTQKKLPPTELEIKEVLSSICNIPSKPGYNAYAKTYAEAGLYMTGTMLRAQIPYVLCNLQWWRGEAARAAKKTLNAFISTR